MHILASGAAAPKEADMKEKSLQTLWRLFAATGEIKYYLLYKAAFKKRR